MSEETPPALPDRLSVNPDSPYYDADVLQRNVGVKFKGQDKTNVEEYCVSEGWVRLSVGTSKDRHGNPLTMKLQGLVEPYYREGQDNLGARLFSPQSGGGQDRSGGVGLLSGFGLA